LDANITAFLSIPLTIDPGGGQDITGTCEGTNWLPRIAIEITANSEREREETGPNKKLKRTSQSAGSYARSDGGRCRHKMSPEGPAKKNRRTPRKFTKSQTYPPTIRPFFPLTFFFSTFLGVSRQGEFKNAIKMFSQKVHIENFSQNFDKHFRCQFSLGLNFFYRVFECSSAMGVQKHYKERATKKIVSKKFYKKFDQKSKTDFFSKFCLSRLWAFLDEGSSKTR
jgi:hypothetical protein